LVLSGSYRPPFGPVGVFGDGLVGHRVARQSLASFLSELAARIERQARSSVPAAGVLPASYPPDLRDLRDRGAAPAENRLG
jgi:hypothetical protein